MAGIDSVDQGSVSGRIRIRRANRSDAEQVSRLLRRAFQEFEPLYTAEAFLATVLAESDVLKRLEEGPLWVTEGPDRVIGTVAAWLWQIPC